MPISKIVIATDSFKESMSAKEAGLAIQCGFQKIFNKTINYDIIPMADGGEGTTDALREALNAETYKVKVHDPLHREIEASYARSQDNNVAIIEMAAASGLDLLKPHERNPLKTSTFGVGELIKDAIDHGVSKIILGIGGSATNDGGSGMLAALGVQFLDENEETLPLGGGYLSQLAHIDISQFDSRLNHIQFEVACDVTNPLLGDNGATAVYGPQKGATDKMIPKLDSALTTYHDMIERDIDKNVKDVPGAGAAGGLGAGILAFFSNASLSKGIDIVLKETQFSKRVKDADLVITGEGKMDAQTIYGKKPIGVAQAAKQYDIPVVAICGSLGDGYEAVYEHGIDSAFSIIEQPMEIDDLLTNGKHNIQRTAENVARLLQQIMKK
ncbi:glycerate kinase [Staphylococcus pragensis]|uniref:Glycerate kinase n=1 Tax=Staphylococcus pragensis TaxID=1611836 RepID=A0A4Z1BAX2_9STAP|nr:glycerate kinase [Staphylococcus pragensis]RTX90058.1 glycerate kinase [Staphylococcus carnosus]TGN27498.1 glycerate kinase [Staphylococcus pragensis]GGG92289.1 glycerate kinase [Staphylococcus pragensis]